MSTVQALAMTSPQSPFGTVEIERRDVGARDVLIEIAFCGICHSDVSRARQSWGTTQYPIVPGHEITGHVLEVGSEVRSFSPGDRVGVGCMVDSCRTCERCLRGDEQYCRAGYTGTYNSLTADGSVTHGGYSRRIVVDEHFVLRIPAAMDLATAAPLLCAGATFYSLLQHHRVTARSRVGILGFGGLGHIGTQIANAMGAHTVALDLDDSKRPDAERLGAAELRVSSDPATYDDLAGSLDLLVSTVPAQLDYDGLIGLLDVDGAFVNLGVPRQPASVSVMPLIVGRRSFGGSLIASMRETQEMLELCAKHGIAAEVEMIDPAGLDAAIDRLVAGDVRYRFVLDAGTIGR
jgi:uncharacterized zinc-type alcohol dehydrogenase-like protein